MDHLVPIVRGGRSSKKNCVPSCRSCNHQRKYFLLEEWALLKMQQLTVNSLDIHPKDFESISHQSQIHTHTEFQIEKESNGHESEL